jgi:hypothetical protein
MFHKIDVCPCCGFDDQVVEGETHKPYIMCLRCDLVMLGDETAKLLPQERIVTINELIDRWNKNGRFQNGGRYVPATYQHPYGRTKGRQK